MLTMAQLANKEMPIDVWHLLEWLGVEYEMDLDEVQKVYQQPKEGAFVILHNLERKFVTPTKTVKAGVYRVARHSPDEPCIRRVNLAKNSTNDIRHSTIDKVNEALKVEWVRPGFSLLDLRS